jgi:hypothetical protein
MCNRTTRPLENGEDVPLERLAIAAMPYASSQFLRHDDTEMLKRREGPDGNAAASHCQRDREKR